MIPDLREDGLRTCKIKTPQNSSKKFRDSIIQGLDVTPEIRAEREREIISFSIRA